MSTPAGRAVIAGKAQPVSQPRPKDSARGAVTPAPERVALKSPVRKAPQIAKNSGPKPSKEADPAAAPGEDVEAQEKRKYEDARAKALQDAQVQTLKQTADNAVTDDEARTARRTFNKALFGRMREIDPSIKERIDAMEAGVLKRLEDQ